ncbi:hypothetical protein N836_21310 [Leptolyngbya sp. Heron Island J]|uniref:hypothetical protein n=1 Tax=Leptolyngbya sp. Heron Island J TaxID=1385935 RepID=UPI0003B94FE6|nr:hypothetical protein [Leptolyngbya sp. Heron Island J]ESA33438.1 hypothetical protein N836_21310 [Leptolyngbya sp. Heron Island J]
MAWQSYGLDQCAQKLVLMARERDPQSLNQSYKMRMAVPYGLERFWGEHLRLKGREEDKALYWKETWNELVKVMAKAGITLPNDKVEPENTKQIQVMSQKLWNISTEDQRVSLAVLTQLCDSIVWWTQRYK